MTKGRVWSLVAVSSLTELGDATEKLSALNSSFVASVSLNLMSANAARKEIIAILYQSKVDQTLLSHRHMWVDLPAKEWTMSAHISPVLATCAVMLTGPLPVGDVLPKSCASIAAKKVV